MAEIYGPNTFLAVDDDVYNIEPLFEGKMDLEETVAYLHGDYYYLYRGTKTKHDFDRTPGLKPGLYKITDDPDRPNGYIFVQEPETDEEKERYRYEDKIGSLAPKDIVNTINGNKEILVKIPEYTKQSFQTIDKSDDILKRILKTAFNLKGISVDDCDGGFKDKNAKFNFKQAMNGPNNLSFMYFDRGCDALNVGYRVTLFEKNPNQVIGAPLDGELSMSTEDTFNL